MTNLSYKKQKKKLCRRRLLAGQVSEKVTDVAKFENLQFPAFKDLSQNKGENQNIVKNTFLLPSRTLKRLFRSIIWDMLTYSDIITGTLVSHPSS